MVSTFPFDPSRIESLTKARIKENGEIEYLMEPEYHGNPVRVSEGSLVFQLPGWDVLDMCSAAGLVNSRMLLVASSRHGIVSTGSVGIFLLFAQKPLSDTPDGFKVSPPANLEYDGPYF